MAQFAATPDASGLDIRPLRDDLGYGVRIVGLTSAQAQDPAIRARIADLFVERGMIVFDDVEQSDEMQVSISTMFGPLKEHPVKGLARVDSERMPGVIELRSEPGRGIIEIDGKQLSHWLPWHFDHCYNDELNYAGVLRSVERTEEGGVTGFLDGVALYAAFPEDLRARIEGHEVAYRLATQYDALQFGRPAQYTVIEPKPLSPEFQAQAAAMSRAIHPAVWTRPSGEKALHVSSYMAEGIVGQENAEGDALLEEVCQAIIRLAPTCSYHHHWSGADMVIWDNTRMLHAVSGHNPRESRLMYRTTIKGDYGLGRWEAGAPAEAADAMA